MKTHDTSIADLPPSAPSSVTRKGPRPFHFFKATSHFLALGLLLFCSAALPAKDRYKSGESLYVWARSGLNLRAEANKGSKILKALPYGSHVSIVAATDLPYAATLFEASEEEAHPYILKGHWVQVSHGGQRGYVFDAYLLAQKPALQEDLDFETYLQRFLVKSDTLSKGVEEDYFACKNHYAIGTRSSISSFEYDGELEYTFQGMNKEEILVLMQYFMGSEGFVRRNWKEELNVEWDYQAFRLYVEEGRIKLFLSYFEEGC